MIRYRTPESIKKRIDTMLKKGEVILDHGVLACEFDHYEYEEASWENNYTSKLHLFYKDFDTNKTVRYYMTVTENNLRKPTKNDWYVELIHCSWDKRWPTLLEMREYLVR